MYFKSKKLRKAEIIEKRILDTCRYGGAKFGSICGSIITIKSTNISFIEPHKAIIDVKNIKLILLYYDNDSLFLFDRTNSLKISDLKCLINNIRQEFISNE